MSIRLGDKTYLLIRKKLEEWEKRKGFLCLGLTIQALSKSVMESAEYSLAEIATQVGFADLAHFSKQFKLKEGVSPSVWRKKLE